jgi:hypothetical protein
MDIAKSTYIPHGLQNCDHVGKSLIQLMTYTVSLSNPFQSIELRPLPSVLLPALPATLI